MTRNKSLVIALTDMRRAFQVRYVKLSLIGVGLMGPVFATFMIAGLALSLSPTSSDYAIMMALLIPMASAMLALMAVVPAGLISANAFVGEKEQRTLEPLLATPLTDQQIILGKVLSSLIPCAILLYGGTLVSTLAINITLLMAGRAPILFPDFPGMFLIFVVGPIVVLAIVSTMILVSSRVSRVYEAYQTGSLAAMIMLIPMFLPFLGLTDGGISIVNAWMTDVITFLIALTAATITWAFALKQFNRDRMVSLV